LNDRIFLYRTAASEPHPPQPNVQHCAAELDHRNVDAVTNGKMICFLEQWFLAESKKMTLDERITFNINQCGGRACVRGMRIRVSDVLEMLAQGVTEQTIFADFPDLEAEDIRACLHFGAQRSGIAHLAA